MGSPVRIGFPSLLSGRDPADEVYRCGILKMGNQNEIRARNYPSPLRSADKLKYWGNPMVRFRSLILISGLLLILPFYQNCAGSRSPVTSDGDVADEMEVYTEESDGLPTPDPIEASKLSADTPGAVTAYESYLKKVLCSATLTDACIEPTSYTATRAGGRRARVDGVYKYRSLLSNGHPAPHMMIEYMRQLRNAYAAAPELYRQQFYNQLDFFFSIAVDRQGALVWENEKGFAHAMEQGEYAAFLLSAAETAHRLKDESLARTYATAAFRFMKALGLKAGVHTGGVRSTTECGSKKARVRPCYWFHSRGVGIIGDARPYTVLNQNLHAIRDALAILARLEKSPDVAALGGDVEAMKAQAADLIIGGLYQLAFSSGTSKTRPPSLAEFLNKRSVKGTTYYWAFYEYVIEKRAGANISALKTCHYHTHVVNLMADILSQARAQRAVLEKYPEGWKAFEALGAIWQDGGALAEFYRSESNPTIKFQLQGCPDKNDFAASAAKLYREEFGF